MPHIYSVKFKLSYTIYVCITTGTQVLIRIHKKADLERDKSCAQNKQRLMWMKINFDLGKSGCHRPCGLDSWLIVEVRHEMKVYEILTVLVVHLFIPE